MKEGDGIRVNGSELTAAGDPVQTWEVYRDGKKIVGPSPQGNFWTRYEALAVFEDLQ